MKPGVSVRQYNPSIEQGQRYFAYISKGYRNSQPVPNLLSGYKPIIISSELPGTVPDNLFYISREREGDAVRGNKVSYEDFYDAILESREIQGLFAELVNSQGSLKVKTFRNHWMYRPQFEMEGVECLGLTPLQSTMLNNKAFQFRLLDGKIPLPEHRISKASDAPQAYRELDKGSGLFVAKAFGGGGSGSYIFRSQEDLAEAIHEWGNEDIVLAEKLSIINCPSIDVLVANPEEIIVYGLMDQLFDDKNPLSCKGNVYPSRIDKKTANDIVEVARVIGKEVAELDIRGHFSIDFNQSSERGLTFGEINARYTGNSAERMLLYELSRPQGKPTLMDLERLALERGTFQGHKLWEPPSDISVYKKDINAIQEGKVTEGFAINDERELFQEKGFTVISWPELGATMLPNDPVGKIVAVTENEADSIKGAERLSEIILDPENERFAKWTDK